MTVVNVKKAYSNGDLKTALRGVKGWNLHVTKYEKSVIARGYECIVHPSFYKSIGTNLEFAIEEAETVLQQVLGVIDGKNK